ncbi:hypothetical protein B7P43_G16735 [Cryptotermes secundus]|uniref:Uncharacterized protein n=1 Tax=Cryptotermes secundus TaxID=105785 RepID=A0A2J7Q1D4_9NEOP|nr:hypothetical protein B7P43_G16735 [Cryptotermes secundus]
MVKIVYTGWEGFLCYMYFELQTLPEFEMEGRITVYGRHARRPHKATWKIVVTACIEGRKAVNNLR